MSKSIAELRASSRVGLPQRSYELCLASTLVAEVQSLLAELEVAMETEAAQSEGNEQAAKPKRMADGSRSREIRTRLGELRGEMSEHTGTLLLKGVTEGAWRLWVDEHPAREGNERDAAVAFGMCNADDLIESLGTYAAAWNGESLGTGDWDFLRENAAPGDIKALAQLVVAMHETTVNIPKLLNSSLGILDE